MDLRLTRPVDFARCSARFSIVSSGADYEAEMIQREQSEKRGEEGKGERNQISFCSSGNVKVSKDSRTHDKQDLALVPTLSESLHESSEPTTIRQTSINDQTSPPLFRYCCTDFL